MKKITIKSLASWGTLIAVALGISSCDLDLQNPNSYDASNYFTTAEDYPMAMINLMNYFRGFDETFTIQGGELRGGLNVTPFTVDGTSGYGGELIANLFSPANPGFSNYAGLSNFILDANNLIYHLENAEGILSENERNYLLGMGYGMRAYVYFFIHKTWGRAVVRTYPDVALGVTDPTELYKAQSSCTETLDFIKSDIAASLASFAAAGNYTNSTFTQNNVNGCFYWNEMATNMLAGNVYLWSGKVSTGDWTANPADVTTAKTYFQNVINSGKYQLMPTCADVFDVNQKNSNTEVIFATWYDLTNGAYTRGIILQYMPSRVTGQILGAGTPSSSPYWQTYEADGTTLSSTATPAGFYYNSTTGETALTDLYTYGGSFQMWYQYKNEVYYSFEDGDSRKLFFFPYYIKNTDEEDLTYIQNFDRSTHYLAGTAYWKFRGQLNTAGNAYTCTNPVPYYRLAEAYLCLAEIANYEGDNTTCANYINMIRQRAFGENWSSQYEFTPGSFVENETAILQEKTREFLQEGQRWWDLRRMTTVKGGSDTDHMVFQPQGNVAYGLSLSQYENTFVRPTNVENAANSRVNQNEVIYDASQAYMVLLPLNTALLSSDPELTQTPGY